MASKNKMNKVDKDHHWGRGGNFLKESDMKMKGVCFFNASTRKRLKSDLKKKINEDFYDECDFDLEKFDCEDKDDTIV